MAPRLVLAGCALAAAGAAQASVWVGQSAVRPTLRVDANGTAQVTFTSGGKQDVVTVPARGRLYHGGSLSGPDVSKRIAMPGLPFAVVVKRTPDGRLWALQRYELKPGAPADLHLSRWRGEPTKLTLSVADGRISGRATFHGRGVGSSYSTLEGKRVRVYVYLDYQVGGDSWRRMLGVAPKADGTFTAWLRPAWQQATRYRATMIGPAIGWTFAPDALATVSAP